MPLKGSDVWENPNSDPMQDILEWKKLYMSNRKPIVQKYELVCESCTRKAPPRNTAMSTRDEALHELAVYKSGNGVSVCPWCGKALHVRAINTLDRVIDTMEESNAESQRQQTR